MHPDCYIVHSTDQRSDGSNILYVVLHLANNHYSGTNAAFLCRVPTASLVTATTIFTPTSLSAIAGYARTLTTSFTMAGNSSDVIVSYDGLLNKTDFFAHYSGPCDNPIGHFAYLCIAGC